MFLKLTAFLVKKMFLLCQQVPFEISFLECDNVSLLNKLYNIILVNTTKLSTRLTNHIPR